MQQSSQHSACFRTVYSSNTPLGMLCGIVGRYSDVLFPCTCDSIVTAESTNETTDISVDNGNIKAQPVNFKKTSLKSNKRKPNKSYSDLLK